MPDPKASLIIRRCSTIPDQIKSCFASGADLAIIDANGSCQVYDGNDGHPLGPGHIQKELFIQDSEVPLSQGMDLSNAWPVGDGRWFGWINEHEGGGRDGSAWLFDPNTSQWIELPRAHHHQVWFATGLRNGGFASLGINSNIGALVIWACSDDPEIITIPHGPGGGHAGLLELTDGSLLIWPFKDDGSAALVMPSAGGGNLCKIWALPGTEGLMGAIPMLSPNRWPRFATWTHSGEVRLWMTERFPAPMIHKSSRRGQAIRTPHHPNRAI